MNCSKVNTYYSVISSQILVQKKCYSPQCHIRHNITVLSISWLHLNKMADVPKSRPPHGTEKYDLADENDPLGALSEEQQFKLNQFKVT